MKKKIEQLKKHIILGDYLLYCSILEFLLNIPQCSIDIKNNNQHTDIISFIDKEYGVLYPVRVYTTDDNKNAFIDCIDSNNNEINEYHINFLYIEDMISLYEYLIYENK